MAPLVRRAGVAPFITLRDAMNSLFEDSFVWPTMGWQAGWRSFPADVYDTGEDIVVRAQLPGVTPEQLNVQVVGNTLTIRGEVKHEYGPSKENGGFYRQELVSGTFERSFTLPTEVDSAKATAKLEHGILTLTLPKAEAAKPKQIQISAAR